MVSGNPRCCQRSLLGRSLEVVGCTLVAKVAINIRSAINMTYTPPNVQRLESLMFNGLESPLLFGIFRFHVQFRLMPWFPSLDWALHPRTWGERACNGKQMASRTSVSVEKQSELLGKQYRWLRIAELSMVLHETPLNYQSIQAMACIAWATGFFLQDIACKTSIASICGTFFVD